MTALRIILGILLVLWIISLVRLGGVAEYSQEGLAVKLRLGPFRFTAFPVKPGKEKQQEKKRPPAAEGHMEKAGGTLSLIMDFLPLAAEAAGTLLRKIRVDELILHLTMAASDPAEAAMGFGAGQAALGVLWPMLERGFKIKDRDVGVEVDFMRTEPVVYMRAALSLTVGQCVAFGAVYGVKALAVFLRHRRRKEKTQDAAPAQYSQRT